MEDYKIFQNVFVSNIKKFRFCNKEIDQHYSPAKTETQSHGPPLQNRALQNFYLTEIFIKHFTKSR